MDDEAPGWDAIDAAFARLYPGVEPAHFATARGIGLGDALQGISAFPADGHWHLVTYGLTELFEKESPYPQQSGFGYELTFRVRRAGDEPPPRWALNVLEQIARTVVDGTDYAAGHRLQTGTIVLAFTRSTRSTSARFGTMSSGSGPPVRSSASR